MIKKWLLHLLMLFVLSIHLTFLGWVVWITYFRPIVRTAQVVNKQEDDFEDIVYYKDDMRGHFHNTDESINIERQNKSICLKCHGTYPHSKAKDVRAFLNAHAFFMACEVCHVRSKDGQRFTYKWIKADNTGELKLLNGKPGRYGALIVPFMKDNNKLKRIDRIISDKVTENYLKLRDTLTADQAAEIKFKIHKKVSAKPVFCDECHRKDGYLNFNKLLYRPDRVNVLTSTEVAGVIKKYKKFYFPTMFDPDAVMMDRWSKPRLP